MADNQQNSGPRGGFVYAIQTPDGHVKIGRTTNMEARLKAFNTLLPKYDVIKKIWVEEDAAWVEHKLHSAFKEYKLAGEWFQLDHTLIKRLVRLMNAEGASQQKKPQQIDRIEKTRKQEEDRASTTLDKISEIVKRGPRKKKVLSLPSFASEEDAFANYCHLYELKHRKPCAISRVSDGHYAIGKIEFAWSVDKIAKEISKMCARMPHLRWWDEGEDQKPAI